MATYQLPTAAKFGISSHGGVYIESIDNDATIEVAELLNSLGKVGRVHTYKDMSKGTVKGHDSVTITPGVGNGGLAIAGGTTIITSFKQSEKNTDFNGWEYSYSQYPDATPL